MLDTISSGASTPPQAGVLSARLQYRHCHRRCLPLALSPAQELGWGPVAAAHNTSSQTQTRQQLRDLLLTLPSPLTENNSLFHIYTEQSSQYNGDFYPASAFKKKKSQTKPINEQVLSQLYFLSTTSIQIQGLTTANSQDTSVLPGSQA